jgi:hypothetical protein
MPKHPEITGDIYESSKHWLRLHLKEPLPIPKLNKYKPHESWFKRSEILPDTHGVGHAARVLILAELLAQILQNQGYSLNREILRWAAVTHDTQRENDIDDEIHGEAAAAWVMGNNSPVPDDLKIAVADLNKLHAPPDFADMSVELIVLKEADALDRVRDPQHFDPRFLRLSQSMTLIPIAQELYRQSTMNPNYGNGKSFDCVLEAANNLNNFLFGSQAFIQ